MAVLTDTQCRTDLLNRLKRAEGQLRGVQRMLESGEDCLAVAAQLSAVRRALESTSLRMTVCFMEQEIGARLASGNTPPPDDLHAMFDQMEQLLGRNR